jgi:hypothetical protein
MAACQEGSSDMAEKPLSPAERAACEGRGGIPYTYTLSMEEGCVIPPPDYGKQCTKSSECSVACSAETRTCMAQVSGAVLMEDGSVETMFVE